MGLFPEFCCALARYTTEVEATSPLRLQRTVQRPSASLNYQTTTIHTHFVWALTWRLNEGYLLHPKAALFENSALITEEGPGFLLALKGTILSDALPRRKH